MNNIKDINVQKHPGFITNFLEVCEWLEENWWWDSVMQQTQFKRSKLFSNADGTFDYKGDVYFKPGDLEFIRVNFNIVEGSFDCSCNRLKTLDGSPKIVKGYFKCNNNQLLDLNGIPKVIKGFFNCKSNPNIKSFQPALKSNISGLVEYDSLTINSVKNKLAYFEYIICCRPNIFCGTYYLNIKLPNNNTSNMYNLKIMGTIKQKLPDLYRELYDFDVDLAEKIAEANPSDSHMYSDFFNYPRSIYRRG